METCGEWAYKSELGSMRNWLFILLFFFPVCAKADLLCMTNWITGSVQCITNWPELCDYLSCLSTGGASSSNAIISIINTNAGTAGQVFSNTITGGEQVEVSTNLPTTTTFTNLIYQIISNTVACFDERCKVPLTSIGGWTNFFLLPGEVSFTNNEVNLNSFGLGDVSFFTNTIAVSNFEVVVCIGINGIDQNGTRVGMFLAPDLSGTNYYYLLTQHGTSDNYFDMGSVSAVRGGNSLVLGGQPVINENEVWVQLVFDQKNITVSLAKDGITWAPVFVVVRTNFIGFGAMTIPAYVGFQFSSSGGGFSTNTEYISSFQQLPCYTNCY